MKRILPFYVINDSWLKRLNFSLFLSVFILFSLNATPLVDEVTISGTVTDNTGEPLIGASVQEKGTTNGVYTDIDGSYSITVSDENSTLVVSYIGYVTQEIPLVGQLSVDIILSEDAVNLSEIVVTGYSTERKSDLTGAVSVLKPADLTDQPLGNVNDLVAGRSPGVDVLPSNQPGGKAAIRIRGYSTIRNNDPLYVIDGVPTTSGINMINPNDIASMQILKDASSSSIYGSRAANGVVLITTKSGTPNRKITYDGYVGSQSVFNLPDMASAQEYGQGLWQAFANDGITPANDVYGSGTQPSIPTYLDDENTIAAANTDWPKEIFRNAIVTSHNLAFSNGSDTHQSYFSLGYFKQDGVLKYTGFDRYSLRLNNKFDLTDRIRIGENLMASLSNTTDVKTNSLLGSPIYDAFRMPSITPVYDVDGNFTGYPINDIQNPLGQLYRNQDNNDRQLRLFGNLFAEIDIIQGLTFRSSYGVNLADFSGTTFNPTYTEPNVQRVAADLTKREENLFNWTFTNTLNYTTTLAEKSDLGVLVGIESIESNLETITAYRQGFPGNDSNFQVLNAGNSSTQQNTNNRVESSLLSYFGKINYDYDDRYLFAFTLRRDGTSKLADHKWGNFPAASFGWRISNEDFFTPNAISDLKLRIGWGQNGNQDIPPYVTSSGYYSNPYNSNYSIDGAETSVIGGFILSGNSNKNLRWETTEQINIGLDMGFVDNRVFLSADYFSKETDDLLLERSLAPSIGGTNSKIWDNVGSMKNSGFEFAMTYRNPYDRALQFTGSLNAAFISNELTKLQEGIDYVGIDASTLHSTNFDQEVSRTTVGQPIAAFYGWVSEGIFQTQAEIDAHAFQSSGTQPGDVKFKDVNGDNVIDAKDREFIGSPHPDMVASLNLHFEYKNFDVTTFFRSAFGNQVYDLTRYYADFYNLSNYNKFSRVTDAWSTANTSSEIPRLSLNDPNNNIRPSTYYVKNANFVKLQSLQFGYDLGNLLPESSGIANMRVYANVQNVFTITKYEGMDPEVGLQNYSSHNQNLDIGVDRGIYPPSRTFSFGLNLGF